MKTIAFCTLGCKVNQYETEAMAELFKQEGYSINSFEEKSDIYVINTCTVTATGDKKSRQMIRRAKSVNPDAVIAVVGCYAQVAPEEVAKIEGVSLVVGTNQKRDIVSLVEKHLTDREKAFAIDDILKDKEYKEMWITSFDERTRAFVKIEDGCNQFCSYCIIPFARGPVRSRPIENICKEVESLADNGYKEIVLTGINISSYGMDSKNNLADVIEEVAKIDGVERIRLGSIEPRVLTEEFIKRIAKIPKVCNHFHISLQSGCDDTLKRMNRKYTTDECMECIENLRTHFDNPSITADVIAGFPGETQDEFESTMEFLKKVKFSEAHIFAYSNRKGTKADTMPDQIPKSEKESRSKQMIALCAETQREYMEKCVGKTYPVLFEREVEKGTYEGHTTNYVRVKALSDSDISHKILDVEITDCLGGTLVGKLKN